MKKIIFMTMKSSKKMKQILKLIKRKKFFQKKMINKTDNSREEGFTHFKEDYKDINAPLIFNKELDFEKKNSAPL